MQVYQNPPPEWRFETVTNGNLDPDLVFHGQYHVYSTSWLASFWNNIRSFRTLIHEDIRDVLLAGFSAKPPKFVDPEHMLLFQRSTNTCYEMQAGILATVPQFLGYVETRAICTTRTSSAESSTDQTAVSDQKRAYTFNWEDLVDEEPIQTHIFTKSPKSLSSNGCVLL